MIRNLMWMSALPIVFASVATAQTQNDIASVEACLKAAEARRQADYADVGEPQPGVEAHLDEAAKQARSAKQSCIGIVADPCMQTEEGSSTYGMMACIARELDVWDARLNQTYKSLLAASTDPAVDQKAADIERQQYRKAQRAWIPWRDATCEVLYSDGIPIYGSQSRVDGAYCYMRLTAEQALRLEDGLFTEN